MPATVVGEITADHTGIILVAAGADHEIADAARKVQTLTPLIKTTFPPGALALPATWPAVVQLAATFGAQWQPGPALTAWVAEQVRSRLPPTAELTVSPPTGLVPRSYQVEAACMIREAGSVLIFDEPGTGKTAETVLGLVERAAAGHPVWPALVIAPASVVDPWIAEFGTWAPQMRAVAWRGTPPQRRALAGTADVYVTSYGIARMDAADTNPRHAPLIALRPAAVVADECVPAGTPIDTPDGPRPIESLHTGDRVLGVDHHTGVLVATTVVRTFTNRTTEPLTHVHGVAMTPNHPVWTARGYLPSTDVRADDTVCEVRRNGMDRDVRTVRAHLGEEPSPQPATAVLQPGVLDDVALRAPRTLGDACHTATSSKASHAFERPDQPVPGSGRASESASSSAHAGVPGADRRERSRTDRAAAVAGGAAGLADGGCGAHTSFVAVPLVVQDRYRLDGSADRDRGGRQGSPRPEGAHPRRTQDGGPDTPGLDGAALPEHADTARDRDGAGRDRGSRLVHNIETGTGNYVAGGLLVHNCHLIRHQATSQSRAVRRLAAKATMFIGLSGTPITHSPADLWPTLMALEPGAWPSKERWVERYCQSIRKDYSVAALGLNPAAEAEFRTTLLGRHRRVAKADVLAELPSKVYSVRTVDLPPDYRTAYDGLENDMLAELPDGGELSVMTVLAQLTRLAQLASAAADIQTVTEMVKDPETGLHMQRTHQKVTLKAPSWKVDALLEVLDERPGEPVVAFAPSRQLITLAGAAATKTGLRVGYIVGGQTAKERTANVDAFQRRELDLICVTTGAGGVGLTLTAARTAVFLQRPWSLVEAVQSEDRLHRLGAQQHTSIDIIDVVARNTIDSRIRTILRERAGQLADLVQDRRIVTDLLGGTDRRTPQKKVPA